MECGIHILVHNDAEDSERRADARILFAVVLISVSVITSFISVVLLRLDKWRPGLSNVLIVGLGILLLPALVFIYIVLDLIVLYLA